MKFTAVFLLAVVGLSPVLAEDQAWNYLGETPPGDTPKLFPFPTSPGFFAAERIAISLDRRSIYYTELNGYNAQMVSRLLMLTWDGAKWSKPALVCSDPGLLAPAFAPGETRLLLDGKITEYHADGWSKPVSFRSGEKCHYLHQTKSGRLYFSVANKNETEWDLVRAAQPGSGAADEKLGLNLAMHPAFGGWDMDFFIAPDESYAILMLTGARDFPCAGNADLFIAFHRSDGSWTKPVTLGAAINRPNPKEWRWGPYVTDDGRYLFFSVVGEQNDPHICWVRFDRLRERLERESR